MERRASQRRVARRARQRDREHRKKKTAGPPKKSGRSRYRQFLVGGRKLKDYLEDGVGMYLPPESLT